MLSGCSFNQDRGVNRTEITVEHLKPILICASNLDFNYDGESSELANLVNQWSDHVLKLDTSCARSAELNLTEVVIKKSEFDNQVRYDKKIAANLTIIEMNGNQSSAETSTYNKLTFEKKSTLAEKEKYLQSLNEKMLNDFDKTMRLSIRRYINK